MHWVERGPEPPGLEARRITYTPRWVAFYPDRVGRRPYDTYWTSFYEDLRDAFRGLCAYCERKLRGEVDHFRPKTKFPELVYCWSNWLFACGECNNAKGDKWPTDGYVDPCAISPLERPEQYFTFETQTGHIIPKRELSPELRRKAQTMIDDLGLNDWQHLEVRVERLELASGLLPDDLSNLTYDERADLEFVSSRDTQLSGIVRSWFSERGYSFDNA